MTETIGMALLVCFYIVHYTFKYNLSPWILLLGGALIAFGLLYRFIRSGPRS
jgi:hypothetical protein